MKLFQKKSEVEGTGPTFEEGEVPPPFAFCEGVWASGGSPWHIRKINPEVGLRLTGGIDTPSLCGRVTPKVNGWDLRVRITNMHLAHKGGVCEGCKDAFIAYCNEHGIRVPDRSR